jgi:cardiolipin synthase
LTDSPLARLVVSHFLSIVGFFMATIPLARTAHQRRPTGSTVAWLLAIVLVPYVGVPFFLIFGGRKVRRHAATTQRQLASAVAGVSRGPRVARMLCAAGAPDRSSGNRVELLGDGEAAFAAVVQTIESASRSIHVSTLVFAGDEVGEAITAMLEAKARAGVDVRLLVDGLFKFRSKRRQIARLRKAGAKVAWFMPLLTFPTRGSMNLRLHRKEVVVDDRLAIIGGMNIAREYMGPTPLETRWPDLSLSITGPAVADICRLFRADWEFASREKLAHLVPPTPEDAAHVAGGASVQVVGSGPDCENDLIYDALLSAVFDAQRRIWIATPYFVPDEAMVHGLLLAIRRGVMVKILVPLQSNHPTADLAGAAYLRELAAAGGIIRCYEPGMMHAKVVLVDDDLGVLGSANMDRRSFFLDYEIALLVDSREDVARMEAWFSPLLEQCIDLPPAGRLRALIEPVARLLAPLV